MTARSHPESNPGAAATSSGTARRAATSSARDAVATADRMASRTSAAVSYRDSSANRRIRAAAKRCRDPGPSPSRRTAEFRDAVWIGRSIGDPRARSSALADLSTHTGPMLTEVALRDFRRAPLDGVEGVEEIFLTAWALFRDRNGTSGGAGRPFDRRIRAHRRQAPEELVAAEYDPRVPFGVLRARACCRAGPAHRSA